MPVTAGQIIEGKYRVCRLLGEGGMGSVYEGENVRIGRRVAIKVLHADVSSRLNMVDRFVREARAAAQIGSKHIADVLDLGELPSGESFIVMEFLEGETLEERVQRGKIAPLELAELTVQLLEGLAQVHEAGIVHRDLKPANIFLARGKLGETVKVLDFGVSKFNTPLEGGMSTETGAILGTPFFMAPEQARGSNREIDCRTDLYAVGVMLYRCAAGRVPFEATNFHELLFKIALATPVPLEEIVPGIDLGFVAIVARAMAREPAGRFATAKEFQRALLDWSGVDRPTARPPRADLQGGGGVHLPGAGNGAAPPPAGRAYPPEAVVPRPRSPMSESVVPLSRTPSDPQRTASEARSKWKKLGLIALGAVGLATGFTMAAATRHAAPSVAAGAVIDLSPHVPLSVDRATVPPSLDAPVATIEVPAPLPAARVLPVPVRAAEPVRPRRHPVREVSTDKGLIAAPAVTAPTAGSGTPTPLTSSAPAPQPAPALEPPRPGRKYRPGI